MKKHTQIENTMLDMIQPRILEIELKFSRGEGLSDQDVNTLLLKSQFNHINHLDERLDEVTGDVAKLRGEFMQLRLEFAALKAEFAELRAEFNVLRAEFNGLRSEFNSLRAEFNSLRADFKRLESTIGLIVSKAIISQMKWSIGLIALILTGIKVLDMLLAH